MGLPPEIRILMLLFLPSAPSNHKPLVKKTGFFFQHLCKTKIMEISSLPD